MSRVTLLEKADGGIWTPEEVSVIRTLGDDVEVESLRSKPNRLVVISKPTKEGTFQGVLGHSDFTVREVDYRDRWS